jgi:hypothetical protein
LCCPGKASTSRQELAITEKVLGLEALDIAVENRKATVSRAKDSRPHLKRSFSTTEILMINVVDILTQ